MSQKPFAIAAVALALFSVGPSQVEAADQSPAFPIVAPKLTPQVTDPWLKEFPDGTYTTGPFNIPQAACHPDCSMNPSDGPKYGDYYEFGENLPQSANGITAIYKNARIAPNTGVDNGCQFDPSNISLTSARVSISVVSRSTACTVALQVDRYLMGPDQPK